jgi:hypothetical protein
MDEQTSAKNMADLLEYCKLDTLAIMKIFEKLQMFHLERRGLNWFI